MPPLSLYKNRPALSIKRRGFIHILLLVFLVLSVSIWGVSEIYFRLRKNNKNPKERVRQPCKRRKGLAPLRHRSTTQNQGEAASGSFNAVGAPFRRFVLPCPDVIEGDDNLDGVADFSCAGADATAYRPLQSGSRFGRLPWRDDLVAGVRGVGNRDFRGSYGERFCIFCPVM